MHRVPLPCASSCPNNPVLEYTRPPVDSMLKSVFRTVVMKLKNLAADLSRCCNCIGGHLAQLSSEIRSNTCAMGSCRSVGFIVIYIEGGLDINDVPQIWLRCELSTCLLAAKTCFLDNLIRALLMGSLLASSCSACCKSLTVRLPSSTASASKSRRSICARTDRNAPLFCMIPIGHKRE
jgi:hypothetical protein